MTAPTTIQEEAPMRKNSLSMSKMSMESKRWDIAEKGFLTEEERLAKEMDTDGSGVLSHDQAIAFAHKFTGLSDENKHIKKQLYGLAILCVLLSIGTISGVVMAIKNNKDTTVDLQTGALKVKGGGAGEQAQDVTVKAHGTTFQTSGTVFIEEKTIDGGTVNNGTADMIKEVSHYCVSGEDVANMWLANEDGIDARLVINNVDEEDDDNDDDAGIISVEPVTAGKASWKKTYVVMGGISFIPNEACTVAIRNGRKLSTTADDELEPFHAVSAHRALKKSITQRRRNLEGYQREETSYAVYYDCDAAECQDDRGNWGSCC